MMQLNCKPFTPKMCNLLIVKKKKPETIKYFLSYRSLVLLNYSPMLSHKYLF